MYPFVMTLDLNLVELSCSNFFLNIHLEPMIHFPILIGTDVSTIFHDLLDKKLITSLFIDSVHCLDFLLFMASLKVFGSGIPKSAKFTVCIFPPHLHALQSHKPAHLMISKSSCYESPKLPSLLPTSCLESCLLLFFFPFPDFIYFQLNCWLLDYLLCIFFNV